MLKKIAIAVGVLSLFIGIFIVHAQPSIHKLENDQYLNVLELPWFEGAETFKAALNAFYNKPKDASWHLRVDQFENATPYYKNGIDEYELPMQLYYPEGMLRSIKATYDNSFYETLVKRVTEDFTDGGYIETSGKIFHTYTRVMDEEGIKVIVEIVYDKTKKEQLMFDATCEKFAPPKEKIDEPDQTERYSVDVFSAAMRNLFSSCVLLSNNVNQ